MGERVQGFSTLPYDDLGRPDVDAYKAGIDELFFREADELPVSRTSLAEALAETEETEALGAA